MIGNWIRQVLREFVEKTFTLELMLKIVNLFFTVLRKAAGATPFAADDEALAKWEASLNKQEIAAAMQQQILDLLLPGLTARMHAGPVDGTQTVTLAQLEAELPTVLAAVKAA